MLSNTNIKTVSTTEALKMIENGATILDPITPEAHEKLHIKGSLNACVYELAFSEKVPQLIVNKETPILVYANRFDSKEAHVAAQKLHNLAYTNINIVTDGLQALREAGCEFEGSNTSLVETLVFIDGTYYTNDEHSKIEWTGRNVNNKHNGTIRLEEGHLEIKDLQIKGHFVIDMTQITDLDLSDSQYAKMLVTHLESDDFFSVKRFPKATFTINSAPRIKDATISSINHTLYGTLELCGISKDLNIPATLVQNSQNQVILEAHFDFDRTLWGVAYGSARFFSFLGMHMVFDPVTISLRVELNTI